MRTRLSRITLCALLVLAPAIDSIAPLSAQTFGSEPGHLYIPPAITVTDDDGNAVLITRKLILSLSRNPVDSAR